MLRVVCLVRNCHARVCDRVRQFFKERSFHFVKVKMAVVRQMRSSAGRSRRSGYVRRSTLAGQLYVQSLLDPRRAGAKIPDSYSARTCTVQLQQTVSVAPVNIGPALTPQFVAGGIAFIGPLPAYTVVHNSSGPKWDSTQLAALDPQNSKLQALFSSSRVVSAAVRVQFTGTTQNDQGTITLFSLNRTDLQRYGSVDLAVPAAGQGGIANPEVTLAQDIPDFGGLDQLINPSELRALPTNAYGPVRLGGVSKYFPMDNKDIEFKPFKQDAGAGDDPLYPLSGVLGFYCEGLDISSSVIFEVVVNLECIPRSDSFHMVSASASPIDALGMAEAQRVISRVPACSVTRSQSTSMRYAIR